LELVRILEASSESLKRSGAPVDLLHRQHRELSKSGIDGVVAQIMPLRRSMEKSDAAKAVASCQ
jgi:hypothetical protein